MVVPIAAPTSAAFMNWPFPYVVILFGAGLAVACVSVYYLLKLGDYFEQRDEGTEEGNRVADILDGMRLAGNSEIDAQRLVGIWYADQPANEALRLAIKTGMYARLREAVRLGWLTCPNFPAHEVRRNFLISLDDASRFFRGRRWLEIKVDE